MLTVHVSNPLILHFPAQVDENFSGDLDVNEWIRLFTSLNESVPVLEARMIFMKIGELPRLLLVDLQCSTVVNF